MKEEIIHSTRQMKYSACYLISVTVWTLVKGGGLIQFYQRVWPILIRSRKNAYCHVRSTVLKRLTHWFLRHLLSIISYKLHLFIFKFQIQCHPNSKSTLLVENLTDVRIAVLRVYMNIEDMWKMLKQEWKNLDRDRARGHYDYSSGKPTNFTNPSLKDQCCPLFNSLVSWSRFHLTEKWLQEITTLFPPSDAWIMWHSFSIIKRFNLSRRTMFF